MLQEVKSAIFSSTLIYLIYLPSAIEASTVAPRAAAYPTRDAARRATVLLLAALGFILWLSGAEIATARVFL